jgi:hypothetical protein
MVSVFRGRRSSERALSCVALPYGAAARMSAAVDVRTLPIVVVDVDGRHCRCAASKAPTRLNAAAARRRGGLTQRIVAAVQFPLARRGGSASETLCPVMMRTKESVMTDRMNLGIIGYILSGATVVVMGVGIFVVQGHLSGRISLDDSRPVLSDTSPTLAR